MTPKGHGVIRGRRDLLYDPKGHGDLCGRFDLVYDPERSQGHKTSPWPTLWPQKVTGSLEVAVTYFMTQRSRDLCGRFDLVNDPKRSQGD